MSSSVDNLYYSAEELRLLKQQPLPAELFTHGVQAGRPPTGEALTLTLTLT